MISQATGTDDHLDARGTAMMYAESRFLRYTISATRATSIKGEVTLRKSNASNGGKAEVEHVHGPRLRHHFGNRICLWSIPLHCVRLDLPAGGSCEIIASLPAGSLSPFPPLGVESGGGSCPSFVDRPSQSALRRDFLVSKGSPGRGLRAPEEYSAGIARYL
jgi:hypothetical protein